MKTRLGFFVALLLLVVAATSNHPSPATADSVPVGDGTKWNSVTYPTGAGGTSYAHYYDPTTDTFGQRSMTGLWTVYCPAGVTCDSSTDSFLGRVQVTYDDAPEARAVRCSATTNGTGTGDVTVYVFPFDNPSPPVCTLTMACTAFTQRGGAVGDCAPAGLSTASGVGMYWDTTACDTPPDNAVCTLIFQKGGV